jgi:hypothetical protein
MSTKRARFDRGAINSKVKVRILILWDRIVSVIGTAPWDMIWNLRIGAWDFTY